MNTPDGLLLDILSLMAEIESELDQIEALIGLDDSTPAPAEVQGAKKPPN